jgi:hypothetical protein
MCDAAATLTADKIKRISAEIAPKKTDSNPNAYAAKSQPIDQVHDPGIAYC